MLHDDDPRTWALALQYFYYADYNSDLTKDAEHWAFTIHTSSPAGIPNGVSAEEILVKGFANDVEPLDPPLSLKDVLSAAGLGDDFLLTEADILIYSLADKYSICGLRECALKKFEETLSYLFSFVTVTTILDRHIASLNGDMKRKLAAEIANSYNGLRHDEEYIDDFDIIRGWIDNDAELRWMVLDAMHDLSTKPCKR